MTGWQDASYEYDYEMWNAAVFFREGGYPGGHFRLQLYGKFFSAYYF